MKRILVTGGAGFIGSHLVERLLQNGHEVIIIDDFSTGHHSNLKHFYNYIEMYKLRIINQDIRNPISNTLGKIDEIYNLASPAAPFDYIKNSRKTILTNTVGLYNILELAEQNGATVLQASTSEVYGDPERHPQREKYTGNVDPFSIRSCYSESKRCSEALMKSFSNTIPIRIARIFNTYGPRMSTNDGRAIPNFIIAILNDNPIIIYGDGKQTRSFCYIDDMINGLITVMEKGYPAPINLGSLEERSIEYLANLIIKLIGKGEIEYRPAILPDDPSKRRPDVFRAWDLGWNAKTTLENGLKKTIEYFKELQ